MIADFTEEQQENYPCLELVFQTPKELEIFKTMIGYYPYDTMIELRKKFGNRFPDVTKEEVISVVTQISDALKITV